jgi:hypothetical protein
MAFPIIPKLNSAPGAGAPGSLTLGELAVNRSTAKLYLGTDTGVQEIAFSGTVAGTAVTEFTGNGAAEFYPINGYTTTDAGAYFVSVAGIEQRPSIDWTITSANGGTVTFSAAPPTGATIVVRAVVAGSGGGGGGSDIGGRAWFSTATYTEGDLVATSQTETWICIQANNTGNDPATSPTWWAPAPASAVQLQFRPLAATAPTAGQVIVWDDANTTWKPGTVSGGSGNATQLQGRDVADTAPAGGQALIWNDGATTWAPTDVFNPNSDSILIGLNATSLGPYQERVVIGKNASGSQSNQSGRESSIAIGTNSNAFYDSVAIGDSSATLNNGAIALGPFNNSNGIVIGSGNYTTQVSILIGNGLSDQDTSGACIKIGNSGMQTVLLGAYDIGGMSGQFGQIEPMRGKINEIISFVNTIGASIAPL